MGFNYLQTDDSDDYLSQFSKRSKKRKVKSFSLINQEGEIILKEVASFKIRQYAKKTYLSHGQSGRYIWRKLLEYKGYKVVNNYFDNQ